MGRLFYADMESVETENTIFYFAKAIDEEDRKGCIEITNAVTEILAQDKKLSLYVFSEDKFGDTLIQDGAVYTTVQDWQTPEYIANILMGVFGEYCSYGTVYGYAEYICDEIGIRAEVGTDDTDISAASEIYDLTLLCFNERFTSPENVAAAKVIAADFISEYIAENGALAVHQLIRISGSFAEYESYCNELAAYYNTQGIEHEPTNMLYSFGGQSFDYIAKNEYATFYIEKDWQDINAAVNPLIYDDFLHENYSDIKQFFEINTQQMADYQKLFGLDEYDNSLRVIFTNRDNGAHSSFYRPVQHLIFLKNIDSLMHEYIHSLTIDFSIGEQWAIEGFARYFSYKYDYYGIAFLNEDYNNPQDIPETQYVREYLEEIGRPIDMAVDFTDVEAIAVYSRDLYRPNDSYVAGSSFVAYLVNNFGEDAVIDYVCQRENGNKIQQYNFDELVEDWKYYIEGKYAKYSKF